MSYEVVTGKAVEPGEEDIEVKIPEKATDLLWPEITLAYRRHYLEKINLLASKIQTWQQEYILGDSPLEKNQEALECLRDRCGYRKIKGSCENPACPKGPGTEILCTENYCNVCTNGKGWHPVQRALGTLRNVASRMRFLEFRLSSSLANQLSQRELYAVLKEIDHWEWVSQVCL